MNNEPVAWMLVDKSWNDFCRYSSYPTEGAIPLYTHPAKTEDEGKVCARCGAIAFDPVITQTAKTLTDEEIIEIWSGMETDTGEQNIAFARAILRKAQDNG